MNNRDETLRDTAEVDVLTERFVGGNRVLGVIIGSAMVVLGILFIARPLDAALALDLFVTAGFLFA
jgi:hypothetical protein